MIYPGCQKLFIFVRQRASRTRVVMILSLDKRPQLLSGAESAGKNIFSVLTKKKKTEYGLEQYKSRAQETNT